ncbi:MAG: hypothetical protein KY440_12645 [Actinobacteria bacterium]|nr:hypothetical protein [Actinomycetota bacterium]
MSAAQRLRGRFAVARSLWAGALVLPLSGVLLVAAAPPASAEITSPGNGAVIDTNRTFDITASYRGLSSKLRLTPPRGQEVVLAEGPDSATETTLAHPFNTSCWDGTRNPCSADRPAPNGEWRVRQTQFDVIGQNDDATISTSTFRLRIPARPPTGVTADASAPQQVRLSWRHGAEPDLTGFAVFEGETQVKTLARGDCRDGACTTVIDYQADGVGPHTYTVSAFRSTGVPGEPPLESRSDPSPPVTVLPGAGLPGPVGDVVPGTEASPAPGSPASASPAPGEPTASRSPAAARPGGSAPAANSTAARRQAFSSGFSAFGPKLGVPKLPPLPQAPAVAQLPDGTFEPTLGFEDQELGEPGPPGGVAARVTSTVGAAFVSEQIVRSTAGALVLLLAGAHLRRWLSTAPPE